MVEGLEGHVDYNSSRSFRDLVLDSLGQQHPEMQASSSRRSKVRTMRDDACCAGTYDRIDGIQSQSLQIVKIARSRRPVE